MKKMKKWKRNSPDVEANLLAEGSVGGVPLEIEDGIAALLLGKSLELINEVTVGGGVGGDLVHNDLSEVAVHLVENVSVLAAGLELVVDGDDIVGDGNSGRLKQGKRENENENEVLGNTLTKFIKKISFFSSFFQGIETPFFLISFKKHGNSHFSLNFQIKFKRKEAKKREQKSTLFFHSFPNASPPGWSPRDLLVLK